jgi:glycylpeptide N-tetradecanoyltransferase
MNTEILDSIQKMDDDKKTKYTNLVSEVDKKPVYEEEHAKLKSYKYWNNQPVVKMNEKVTENKIIDEIHYKEKPLMPEKCNVKSLDLNNNDDMEAVIKLLDKHYIGDVNLKPVYTKEHLKLFLGLPSNKKYNDLSVMLYFEDNLIGFIAGCIKDFVLNDKLMKMGEVNFLSINKDYRNKGYAEYLIDEITHRIENYKDENGDRIKVGFYISDRYLPKPYAKCECYHRPLNFKKLYDCGFVNKNDVKDLNGTISYYDVLDESRMRKICEEDIEALVEFLNEDASKKYVFYEKFNVEDFRYFFMESSVIHSYVLVDKDDDELIEDFVSFYELNSTTEYIDKKYVTEIVYAGPKGGKKSRKQRVLQEKEKKDTLKTVYLYYYTRVNTTKYVLFEEISRMGKKLEMDLINSLNIFEDGDTLKEYKYLSGTDKLNYYFYNYANEEIMPRKIGKMNL